MFKIHSDDKEVDEFGLNCVKVVSHSSYMRITRFPQHKGYLCLTSFMVLKFHSQPRSWGIIPKCIATNGSNNQPLIERGAVYTELSKTFS